MGGRILAIGDIHGCSRALQTLLDAVRPVADDTIVVLGDLIDRGPDSKAVVDKLLLLSRQCTLIGICGNHEEMMLQSLERGSPRLLWIGAGADATLRSYGGTLAQVPQEHIDFLQSLRDHWQTDTHIFVHGNINSVLSLEQQVPATLRWNSITGDEAPHCSGKTVVCGHTVQASGQPLLINGFICIDTGACSGLWLTCLDIGSGTIWQAAETGTLRGPMLLETGRGKESKRA